MAAAAAAAAGGCGGAAGAGAALASATLRGAEIVDEAGVPLPPGAVAGWVPSVDGATKVLPGWTVLMSDVAALGKALVAAVGVPEKSYFEARPTRIVNRHTVCAEWFATEGSEREGVVVDALKAFFEALRALPVMHGAPVDWFPAGYTILTSVRPDGTVYNIHGYKTTIPAEACWGWADELAAAAAVGPAPPPVALPTVAEVLEEGGETVLPAARKLTAKEVRLAEKVEVTRLSDEGDVPRDGVWHPESLEEAARVLAAARPDSPRPPPAAALLTPAEEDAKEAADVETAALALLLAEASKEGEMADLCRASLAGCAVVLKPTDFEEGEELERNRAFNAAQFAASLAGVAGVE